MSEFLQALPDGRVFVDYGPTSMVITARRAGAPCPELAEAAFPLIQSSLEEIAQALPILRQYPKDGDFSALEGLPRVMAEAVLSTGEPTLTPMAAVAGAVADAVADWIFARGADLVAVNNGGDVALRLAEGQQLRMGILPDLDGGGISRIVTLRAEDGVGGVCTSGQGGRSLTRGVASAVTVFSRRCALADACAPTSPTALISIPPGSVSARPESWNRTVISPNLLLWRRWPLLPGRRKLGRRPRRWRKRPGSMGEATSCGARLTYKASGCSGRKSGFLRHKHKKSERKYFYTLCEEELS